ncbi:MAG: Ig-like domain-containing protein [Flavobacteriales bacterium]|nr:Ig-like domain-containing protein [Flavobacteriales bacterium]
MRPTCAVWGLMVVILGGCASVQSIGGGAQDTAPPALVSAFPPDRSIRFNAGAILLEFDERVQLDLPRERLLVSPPLKALPDVRLAGPRGVEIRLNAPLEPGTTYTFHLGDRVKDLTEGNTSPDLTYVVSTGDHLDSGRFVGKVVNAFTEKPEKGMMVGLYAPGDTTAFRQGRPAYMTRTDASGRFTLANLPAGRSSVFALHDKNADQRYDLPNEEVAFLDSIITITPGDTAVRSHVLRAFLPASARQQVRSYSVNADGALELVVARPMGTIAVRDVARSGGALRWTPEFNATRDSILLWPSDTTLLSQGTYEISEAGVVLDTVRYRPTIKRPFHTGLTATLIDGKDPASILIRSARPILQIDSTRISLLHDSVPVPFTVVREDDRRCSLLFQAASGSSYRLTVLPKAIRDIHGGTNDTLRTLLGTAEERTFGSLQVGISGLAPNGRYLLQVLDGQQRVQHEAVVTAALPVVRWDRLAPGSRTLRLVLDRNGNGHWDTGEWASLTQAERTWHHPEPVNIRSGWDVKVDWSLQAPPPAGEPER